MLKFILIAMLLTIIFVLDKLYLLPLHVPLDTEPNNKRSAIYLVKTIAKKAKCNNIYLENININEKNTILNFDCNFGSTDKNTYTPFYIHVFLNNKVIDTWINRLNKDSSDEQCFKKGVSYVICDGSWPPNITLQETKKKSISNGQKYYRQFPGEDINITIDS